MPENIEEETGEKTPGQSSQTADLTADEAYRLYTEEDLSYREIGEQAGVSKDTARRRVKAFERGREQGIEQGRQEGLSQASSDDLRDALSDRLSDDDEFQCQSCGARIDFLQSQCGNCGTVLDWGAVGGSGGGEQ